MIRVRPAPEPPSFQERVRDPGLRAIAEMVGETPPRAAGRRFAKRADRREDIDADEFPPYWTEALDDLMVAYNRICAYSCFRIHPVTGARSVDHMAPKSRAWDTVYEWTNYRLACALLNARKKDFSDVLDPFDIVSVWFQLELAGFQVLPGHGLKGLVRTEVERTIDRLGLDDFIFRDARKRDAENYWSERVSLAVLAEESPFVARELTRQGRLNAGDLL
jgi:hypothetical protein